MDIKKLIKEEFDNYIITEGRSHVVQKAKNALKALYKVLNSISNNEKGYYKLLNKAVTYVYQLGMVSGDRQIGGIYDFLYESMMSYDENLYKKLNNCYKALYSYYNDLMNGKIDQETKYVAIYAGNDSALVDEYVEKYSKPYEVQTSGDTNTETDSGQDGMEQTQQEPVQTNNPQTQAAIQQISNDVSGYDGVNIDFYETNWFGNKLDDDFDTPYNAGR